MGDFGKSYGYAKKSIMAYVGIWIVATVLGMLPVLNIVGALLGTLQFWIINPILLAYAGYIAVKVGKEELAGSAMAGAVAGLVGSVVVAIITMVLALVGVSAVASQGEAMGAGTGALVTGIIGIALVVMIIIITVAGAILGAVGGFFAVSQAKKK